MAAANLGHPAVCSGYGQAERSCTCWLGPGLLHVTPLYLLLPLCPMHLPFSHGRAHACSCSMHLCSHPHAGRTPAKQTATIPPGCWPPCAWSVAQCLARCRRLCRLAQCVCCPPWLQCKHPVLVGGVHVHCSHVCATLHSTLVHLFVCTTHCPHPPSPLFMPHRTSHHLPHTTPYSHCPSRTPLSPILPSFLSPPFPPHLLPPPQPPPLPPPPARPPSTPPPLAVTNTGRG